MEAGLLNLPFAGRRLAPTASPLREFAAFGGPEVGARRDVSAAMAARRGRQVRVRTAEDRVAGRRIADLARTARDRAHGGEAR